MSNISAVREQQLYKFRERSRANYCYITAGSLHDASVLLHELGYQPECIQYEGVLVSKREEKANE